MKKIITIEMDDSYFTSKKNTELVTHGISACIAFVIYASFFDEDDELIHARGLYHWSGYSLEQINPEQETRDVFSNFLDEFRETFDLPYEFEIQIDNLIFVGGEKAAWENGELVLSGTENEVFNLIKVVHEFDFSGSYFKIDPEHVSHHHFITSGEEALTLKVQSDQCIYIKESLENNYGDEETPPVPSFK
ncbi:MAG: hypothetical protein M1486_05320 [Gammaproteobacteria bacterium]|nr:hypothetical protein [Gammaproteobacteria bacterium]